MASYLRQTMVAFFVLLFFATPALAHKVNVFAYVEKNIVYTESYFPDGRPVVDGLIEVLDSANVKVVTGKTDGKGLFSFPLPKKNDLTIVIDAGMGHKNSFFLPKAEM